jgi:hypothetical protein
MSESVKEQSQQSQKKEKELCGICADAYTAVLRRKIICKYCSKDACTKCIEQYLLSRPEDAHCIHCRVNYSDAVLKEICTKTYLQQTYFRHRQDILINRERANLPALQDTAQRVRRARTHEGIIAGINEEIAALRQQKTALVGRASMLYVQSRERLKEGHDMTREQAELMQLTLSERELTHRMYRKRDEIMAIRRAMVLRAVEDDVDEKEATEANEERDEKDEKEEKEEKKKFIRRCMKGGCQGFLSTAWKCGICEHYSCGKCFTVKGPAHDTPHTCSAEDLATADMIRLDSKPCPSCGEFINKSSGCNQMFCLTCKTPWDWNTGKIVTKGVIHNPHYYEWLRRNGGEMARNPADVPCGGYPNGYELRPVNRCASPRNANYFFEFHRLCMETQEHSERGFRSHLDQDGLQRTHVRFLLGDFEEKEWGRQLATAEKKRKRDAEIQEVFAAFRMVAVELLNRVQQYRDETVDTFTLLPRARADAYLVTWNEEVQELIQMVNEGMKAISLSYSCSVPRIFVVHGNVTAYRLLSHKWVKAQRVAKKHQEKEEKEQKQEQEQDEKETVAVRGCTVCGAIHSEENKYCIPPSEEEEEEEDEDEEHEDEVDNEVLRHVLEKSMKEM